MSQPQISRRIRVAAWPAALGALLLLAGCVEPGPMAVPLKYYPEPAAEPVADQHRPAKPALACAVLLAEVRDVRDDQTSLGSAGLKPIETTDTQGWLAGAIKASVAGPGVTLVDAPQAQPAPVALGADLLKVYVSTMNMAKTATVVVRVRFRQGDKDLGQALYRGDSSGVYWGVGKAEMEVALNEAMRRAMAPLRQDLAGRCAARAPGAPARP